MLNAESGKAEVLWQSNILLLSLDDQTKSLYLVDTFEGMPNPGDNDVSFTGESAESLMKKEDKSLSDSIWCCVDIEEVKRNVLSVGYNPDKINFIKGKIENTLPANAPESLSLLRLDTDWYESTRHALIHLFSRVSPRRSYYY